ncbi:uncharacterized protein BKA55DRAFT_586139 [Fusarium redolens]|uniref:Uncharacterized protein n=1 Tax=Fusarium redolens TaxID=48865 RepID=A0A9P9JT56_FUSRE|nr:uncharacterized protein BKA55DRAFT_586139 [Fusarium redolens]KAH7208450.1 hypothetical protein BKA55DRAFT_586139 [Fusarium redolens]
MLGYCSFFVRCNHKRVAQDNMFRTDSAPECLIMEKDTKLRELIEVTSQLLHHATSCERVRLQSSVQLLVACASVKPRQCIIDLLNQELQEQIAWATMYRRYQSQPDIAAVRMGNGWPSASFDRDEWLHEFANEVLEGAETICMILDQSPEHMDVRRSWVPVIRRSHSTRVDDDQCSASESDDMGKEELHGVGEDVEYWGPKESDEDDRDISDLGPKKLCFWYF